MFRSSVLRPAASAALLLAVALAGCSRQDQVDPGAIAADSAPPGDLGQPVMGDWVIQDIQADPDTLNPVTAQDDTSQDMDSKLFDSLLFQNRTTLKLEPALASSYDISADGMIYTFHLRHDVKWHDGQPFTADDVKFSYDRIQDPLVDAAPLRIYFANIKSCEVLDPYTVRFTSTKRYFKTLEVLGSTYLDIIPKHCFKGTDAASFNSSSFGRAPIGTGPYKFVRWDAGAVVVLERNDSYWRGPGHYPKRLVFQVIPETSVTMQLLKKGNIDLVNGISPINWTRELEHSRSMSRLERIVYPFPAYTYLGFNLRNPLFTDVRVRHAVDLLMPRAKILSQIYLNDYATECSGYDPPSSPNYNHDVPPTPEDPALAKQLLSQAGWRMDHGDGLLYKNGKPFTFTVLYPAGGPTAEKIAEMMQEALAGAGIQLNLERLEFVQLIERTEDWKFDTVIASWALDIDGDPFQIWDGSQAGIKRSSDFIGYENPIADKLIADGRLEYDQDKRAVIFRHLQQVIHDDYPVCFLFNPKLIMIVSKRYQGVITFAPRPCIDPGYWWVPRPMQRYQD